MCAAQAVEESVPSVSDGVDRADSGSKHDDKQKLHSKISSSTSGVNNTPLPTTMEELTALCYTLRAEHEESRALIQHQTERADKYRKKSHMLKTVVKRLEKLYIDTRVKEAVLEMRLEQEKKL